MWYRKRFKKIAGRAFGGNLNLGFAKPLGMGGGVDAYYLCLHLLVQSLPILETGELSDGQLPAEM